MKNRITLFITTATILFVANLPFASAHTRSSLPNQIGQCGFKHINFNDYIVCGFGESGIIDARYLYADDRYSDGHCVYGKIIKSSGRALTVKSCGATKGVNLSRADYTWEFANCITGHWWCRWS